MDFFRGYIELNGKTATQGFKKGTQLKTLDDVRDCKKLCGYIGGRRYFDRYRRLRGIGKVNADR